MTSQESERVVYVWRGGRRWYVPPLPAHSLTQADLDALAAEQGVPVAALCAIAEGSPLYAHAPGAAAWRGEPPAEPQPAAPPEAPPPPRRRKG